MNRTILFSLIFLVFFLLACSHKPSNTYLLIKGGTLINISEQGRTEEVINNSYILVRDSLIVDYGILSANNNFPEDCIEIDATAKYIIPGLIDGFGTINNQDYADAYLRAGVTSIIGVESVRRGKLYLEGNPSPDIFLMGDTGDVPQTDDEIKEEFRKASEKGISVMLLMYKLSPEQVRLCVELAGKYGIATIGELGFTSYRVASSIGAESFVHISRFSLDMAPAEMRIAVAEDPFSDDLNSPKWQYYMHLTDIDTAGSVFKEYAGVLGDYSGFVIPTLSLLYLDLPDHNNPWNDPLSEFIAAADINNPADRQTGNHNYDSPYQEAYTGLAVKQIELANGYYRAGVKFLAGSAADVWGTMPGISLHTELELLKRSGLSNREVIATATGNFSDAYGWRKGKIKKDYYADILVLDDNPLESLDNLRSISKVILKGQIIDEL